MSKVAIIGAGIAGSTAALYFGKLGLDITLFEKKSSLISGPPFCHLHAGGNLYREIPDSECITLLEQSIDLVKLYPYAVDYRPTVIAIPKEDEGTPEDLFPRLSLLQTKYQELIDKDPSNAVLGKSNDYFKLYSKEDIEKLQKLDIVKLPKTLDQWLIPVAKNIDFSKIKLPLIVVQEYGLNLFSMAAGVELILKDLANCKIKFNHKITNIQKCEDGYIIENENFDYLINAAGFETGSIDDMLKFKRDRLVEFKAAYVTKWENCNEIWPEIIFHGTRETPQGMGQLTPYPNGYFQLHGMTKDITLFENGLVQNDKNSSQPKLNNSFIDKINNSWNQKETEERTKKAISHLSKFIPSFSQAKIASKPLYGAQQIPGRNKKLRASDVSFEHKRYARCEIVKASSVLSMCDQIALQLIKLNMLNEKSFKTRDFKTINLSTELVSQYGEELSQQRQYPQSLGKRNITHKQF